MQCLLFCVIVSELASRPTLSRVVGIGGGAMKKGVCLFGLISNINNVQSDFEKLTCI